MLGVTGSIAIYRALDLARKLTQAGARVDVVMTGEAKRFVSDLSFQALTGRRAYSDMFDVASGTAELHLELGRRADVLVVAPATATTIARMALGLAEDLLSLTALATRAPVIVCPAMDWQMFQHEATQAHLDTLRKRDVLVLGPDEGPLASGEVGMGRLVEVERIFQAVRRTLGRNGDMSGRKVVVTAGGTQEPIDPVRYVGNYSSGKMGFAIAQAARDRGAEVTLITGPSALDDPYYVRVIRVRRAVEMCDAVVSECETADVLIMAAAVADYQPAETAGQKMKRSQEGILLSLVPTPDILKEVPSRQGLIKVGFAAESEEVRVNARKKLDAKDLDLIAANDITALGSGFGSDTNKVILLGPGDEQEELPLLSKYEVGQRILDKTLNILQNKNE